MRWRSALVVLLVLMPAAVWAQTGTPSSRLEWVQGNATLAEASAYTYRQYPDAATSGVVLTGVTCAAVATVTTCSAPFPAFTPGSHALTLSAANSAGEGLKSASFAFTFIVLPSAPASIRIVP